MKIDFVFTYVDGNDPSFESEMQKYAKIEGKKIPKNSSRFRDWETLPYLLRGIEQNMPWINNVYMVVKSPDQVPSYVNTEKIKIIYHEQIIPYKFLPTFNSNTIELFLYNIPELSEYFLYSNDDIFTINPSTPDMWYNEEGIPKIKVLYKLQRPYNIYTKTLKETEILCKKEKNIMIQKNQFLRGDHNIFVMRKSIWELFWKKHKYELEESITRFRNEKNITIELSNFYWFLTNYIEHSRKNYYHAFLYKTMFNLENEIMSKNIISVCINDLGVKIFENTKKEVHAILSKKFPAKSKYEK